MNFTHSELHPWLKVDYTSLAKMVERMPSAVLLHAPDGLGLENLAAHWIQFILCENQQNQTACGVCRACTLLRDGSHPDFYCLTLNEDEDKKTIGVEKIREVVEFLAVTTHITQHKIVLIEDWSLLTLSSANALLKILEEPPTYAVFILLSNNIAQILPTIKSRCLKYGVKVPIHGEIQPYLENKNIDNYDFWLRFYDDCPLFEPEITDEQLETLVQTLLRPSVENIYALITEFDGKTISFEFTINFVSKWIGDLVSYKMTGQLNYFVNYMAVVMHVDKLIERLKLQDAFYLQDQVNQLRPWSKHPLNYKLQIENILLQYQQLFVNARIT